MVIKARKSAPSNLTRSLLDQGKLDREGVEGYRNILPRQGATAQGDPLSNSKPSHMVMGGLPVHAVPKYR